MEIKTRDRKKERTVILCTIGALVVLFFIWGFQLKGMFTKEWREKFNNSKEQYTESMIEFEAFKQDISQEVPQLKAWEQEQQLMLQEQQAQEAQEAEVLERAVEDVRRVLEAREHEQIDEDSLTEQEAVD